MRLYPKRLRNLEDLEKEKQFLIKRNKQLNKEEFLSLEGLLGKKKTGDKEKGEGSILDFLPIGNPLVGQVAKVALSMLSKREKKPKIAFAPAPASDNKPGKSKLKVIAIEFIGGYLKWKAIELSYRGIRRLIRARKEKKQAVE